MSSKTQFTILTDRSHGGASLKDGSVELMVRGCVTMCVRLLCSLLCLCVTGYVYKFTIMCLTDSVYMLMVMINDVCSLFTPYIAVSLYACLCVCIILYNCTWFALL